MSNGVVSRDEFETVKQLLASAASYAESANRQSDRNTALIADNSQNIAALSAGISELKASQDRTQQQLDLLGERQDRTQQQLDALSERQASSQQQIEALGEQQRSTQRQLESFIFESQRLMSGHAERIQKLEGISERLEGILSYLVR